MIRLSAVLAVLACALVSLPARAEIDAFAQVRQMQRGVNVLADDPIWRDRAKARFKSRHFTLIRDAGFSTVRIVVKAFEHMDANDALDPKFLETLDWAVHAALANGLTVVMDEHDHNFCGRDASQCRRKLMAFWRQAAARYRNEPDRVVFEILNEPNQALTPALWNDFVREALGIIRATNPTRNVIVGPGFWNGIGYLDTLALPENDRHLIVTVHYYTPMKFTHQGAPWSPENLHYSGIGWGSEAEVARLGNDFAAVARWARAHKRPIFLGEFGAYDKGPMEDRVRYTRAVAREAESHGWAWGYWQFDSDFIVYDIDKDRWVEPIRKALIPASASPP